MDWQSRYQQNAKGLTIQLPTVRLHPCRSALDRAGAAMDVQGDRAAAAGRRLFLCTAERYGVRGLSRFCMAVIENHFVVTTEYDLLCCMFSATVL